MPIALFLLCLAAEAAGPLSTPGAADVLRDAADRVEAGDEDGAEALLRELLARDGRQAEEAAAAQITAALAEVDRGLVDLGRRMLTQVIATWGVTDAARQARRHLAELEVLGQRLEAEPADWIQGEPLALNRGSRLLLFFESWCPHCKVALSRVSTLRGARPGLEVVGITQLTRGTTTTDVTALAKARGASFPIAFDAGPISEALGIHGVPALVILREGVVVWRGHPDRLSDAVLGSAATP